MSVDTCFKAMGKTLTDLEELNRVRNLLEQKGDEGIPFATRLGAHRDEIAEAYNKLRVETQNIPPEQEKLVEFKTSLDRLLAAAKIDINRMLKMFSLDKAASTGKPKAKGKAMAKANAAPGQQEVEETVDGEATAAEDEEHS